MKKSILILIASVLIYTANAQTKKGKAEPIKKMSYEKHVELSKLEIEGYKNSHIKLIDTTKKSKESYVIFNKNEKLSNNFETDVVVFFGECNPLFAYKGNLTNYQKKPSGGIIRGPKENVQPNTKDSSWVISIDDKKVIMNYYYCFFTNEAGEIRAKSTMLAHFDNGVNNIEVRIRPKDFISKESGLTKIKNEAEYKAKLAKINELEIEVTNAMKVYLKNL